jgi:hypothetical protein
MLGYHVRSGNQEVAAGAGGKVRGEKKKKWVSDPRYQLKYIMDEHY